MGLASLHRCGVVVCLLQTNSRNGSDENLFDPPSVKEPPPPRRTKLPRRYLTRPPLPLPYPKLNLRLTSPRFDSPRDTTTPPKAQASHDHQPQQQPILTVDSGVQTVSDAATEIFLVGKEDKGVLAAVDRFPVYNRNGRGTSPTRPRQPAVDKSVAGEREREREKGTEREKDKTSQPTAAGVGGELCSRHQQSDSLRLSPPVRHRDVSPPKAHKMTVEVRCAVHDQTPAIPHTHSKTHTTLFL